METKLFLFLGIWSIQQKNPEWWWYIQFQISYKLSCKYGSNFWIFNSNRMILKALKRIELSLAGDSGCGIPRQNIGSWGMYLHTTFWKKVEDRPINQKSRRYRAFANVQLQLLLWTNAQRWDTKSRNTNSCSGSLLRISRISKYHV